MLQRSLKHEKSLNRQQIRQRLLKMCIESRKLNRRMKFNAKRGIKSGKNDFMIEENIKKIEIENKIIFDNNLKTQLANDIIDHFISIETDISNESIEHEQERNLEFYNQILQDNIDRLS